MGIVLQPESEKGKEGVIAYLRKNNALEHSISTFGSPQFENYYSEHILTLTEIPFYASEELAFNQEVGIQLHNHKLLPTAYTICQYRNEGYYLDKWELKAQEFNDSEWVTINSQDGQGREFCKSGILETFQITQNITKFYRNFKIVNTGIDCEGSKALRLGGIEFFGLFSLDSDETPKDKKIFSFQSVLKYQILFLFET